MFFFCTTRVSQEKAYTVELIIILLIQAVILPRPVYGRENDFAATRFLKQGEETTLFCEVPSDVSLLKWIFLKNGTEFAQDAAQVYPGNILKVFHPFDSPPGRSELREGSFIIHSVDVQDEGLYWCKISKPNSRPTYSLKYPVHVYVSPLEPQIISLYNKTLTEYENATVARCSSQGGKPGSTLVWMNGSTLISSVSDIFYKKNAISSVLTDGFLDLLITNASRYDNRRSFSCVIDHPTYEGQKKTLNYTIFVKYHPINVRIWANLTSLYIFCEAESYPRASYTWKLPGKVTKFKGRSLYIQDLYEMPGDEYVECNASNGIPPSSTVRVMVDDLLYPNGKPGRRGLIWWVWILIVGGVVTLAALTIF